MFFRYYYTARKEYAEDYEDDNDNDFRYYYTPRKEYDGDYNE